MSGGKQARTLADVASSAAQVPLCARVAASLAPVFPDVSAQLVHILEDEFAALQVCWHTHQQASPFKQGSPPMSALKGHDVHVRHALQSL